MIYVQALMVSRPTDPKLGAWFRKLETCAAGLLPSIGCPRGAECTTPTGDRSRHQRKTPRTRGRYMSAAVAARRPRVATANAWHAHQGQRRPCRQVARPGDDWHARRVAPPRSRTLSWASRWQLSQGRMGEAERTCATLLDSKGTLHDPVYTVDPVRLVTQLTPTGSSVRSAAPTVARNPTLERASRGTSTACSRPRGVT